MADKNQIKIRKEYECLEQVVGCKWSVSVLMAIQNGIERPGALERAIKGISTKILTERLRKLTEYNLLDKKKFNEVPAKTIYTLTNKGKMLVKIIEQLHELDSSE